MAHIYSDTFFDYIDRGARRSAQQMLGFLGPLLKPTSVIDLGSGRGVWLDEWRKFGVENVLAVDGDYVDCDQLVVPRDIFVAQDLTMPVDTGRRFDLAQSLEVGEHLPKSASETLIDSLTRASDRVLFSAAVTGQGGEFHINEQPLSFWQGLFKKRGYAAYDCIRPSLAENHKVEPWYRYNTVLYVNEAGQNGLPQAVTEHSLSENETLQNGGDAKWKLRCNVVSYLPRGTVTTIAQVRAGISAARARSACF